MVSVFYFTPLPGFFSPFPHGTCSLSVTREYLALRDGPRGFRQDSTCPRRTQDTSKRSQDFAYRIFTFYDLTFQIIRLSYDFVTPYRKSYNPSPKDWFGLFPFRSPLLRKSIFLSLPPATKMFQFTGCSYIPMYSVCSN